MTQVSPCWLRYPGNGDLYVSGLTSTIAVISTSTNKVVDTISLSSGLWDIAVNAKNKDTYVTNIDGSISIINVQNTIVKTISGFAALRGIKYDPANGDIYVMDYGGNSVLVLNSANSVISTTSLGSYSPWETAFNPGESRHLCS